MELNTEDASTKEVKEKMNDLTITNKEPARTSEELKKRLRAIIDGTDESEEVKAYHNVKKKIRAIEKEANILQQKEQRENELKARNKWLFDNDLSEDFELKVTTQSVGHLEGWCDCDSNEELSVGACECDSDCGDCECHKEHLEDTFAFDADLDCYWMVHVRSAFMYKTSEYRYYKRTHGCTNYLEYEWNAKNPFDRYPVFSDKVKKIMTAIKENRDDVDGWFRR